MRVVQVSTERAFRGGEQQLLLLLAGLQAERPDIEASVVAQPGSALAERARAAGHDVTEIAMGAALDFGAAGRLRAHLREVQPALVHAHTAHAHGHGWRAVRGLGPAPPRLLVTRHVAYSIFRHSFLRLNRRKYVRGCDRILCVSRAVERALLTDGVPQPQLQVVRSGIDVGVWARDEAARAQARATLGASDDTLVLGAVGALTPEKGRVHLLEAFALLDPARRDARLVLLGDGPLRTELEARAEGLAIVDRVHFLGHLDDVATWLSAFDVFSAPSESEGLSLSLMQAMAAGLPVIASEVGGMPEVVGSGGAGRLVPPGDVAALAAELAALSEDKGLRASLGEAAQSRAQAVFSHRAAAAQTAALYDALVAR